MIHNLTAAPRSSVIHAIDGRPGVSGHVTYCGRRIGDEWAGEYTEAPSGPVSCRQCLPVVTAEETAEAERLAVLAEHPVGASVGIVRGVQAVGGPSVYAYGTVVRHVMFWRGTLEYVVSVDGTEELYRPYLLRPDLRDVADETGVTLADDGMPVIGHPVWQYMAEHRSHLTTADAIRGWARHARMRSMRSHPAGRARVPSVAELSALLGDDPWGTHSDEVYPMPGVTIVGGLPVRRPYC